MSLDKFNSSLVLYFLLFPTTFQQPLVGWAWAQNDDFLLAFVKRLFFLLPSAAVIAACWVSIACLLTVIVRHKRREYLGLLFITWWDLIRSIFSFWAGLFKFVLYVLSLALALIRLLVLALWWLVLDIILVPWRTLRGLGSFASEAGTPWLAVWLTLAWCMLEAAVLTMMMTYTVVDIVAGVTQGFEPNTELVQMVLFVMLSVLLIGSYALLANFSSAIEQRSIKKIILLFVVELGAWFFEVMFLYREFVDALVPWLAQHAGEDFSLGPIAVIGIATVAWVGIRGFTWFFFAAYGTPTILAIIQRTGLSSSKKGTFHITTKDHFFYIREALDKIKSDVNWLHEKGDELVSAFVLPPMQIVAAVINFLTLLVSARHLFQLPFKNYKDMLHADQLLSQIRE